MEDNEQPPAPIVEARAPQVAERSLWNLSRDEQRILIITFVGGLASIVAGVCVVGVAIALARGIRAIHLPLSALVGLTVAYTGYVISIALDFRRRSRSRPRSTVASIVLLLFYVALSICLLAWIGVAAGIH
jgi:hypothetical protein